mmetsp:Transcript_2269/g.3186  ORF Transcript_2269/g.3186 Transcript_2269/m.3186 type:complete len:82 (+) Transcript_2269:1940-2185(+)
MKALKATQDEQAIKFSSLGFCSSSEAAAWLSLHSVSRDFGYLVDFHTLIEHVHANIANEDSLKSMERIYKLTLGISHRLVL